MSEKVFATVEWTVEDVLINAKQLGIPLSRKTAHRLLSDREEKITDVMVEAGWSLIEEALTERSARRS